jgi:hypothetical protein
MGPERPKDLGYEHLRHAARRILFDNLNDRSRYEVIAPDILHDVELRRIRMVLSNPFGVLFIVAGVGPVDYDPSISSRGIGLIVAGESSGGKG